MKKVGYSFCIVVVAMLLVGAGAWAKGVYDEYVKQKEATITMRFGQMESSANAEYTADVENYRNDDMKRVEKEVNDYLEKKLSEAGHAYFNSLNVDEEKAKIKTEHDQLIQQLKDYIDQQASGYLVNNK